MWPGGIKQLRPGCTGRTSLTGTTWRNLRPWSRSFAPWPGVGSSADGWSSALGLEDNPYAPSGRPELVMGRSGWRSSMPSTALSTQPCVGGAASRVDHDRLRCPSGRSDPRRSNDSIRKF